MREFEENIGNAAATKEKIRARYKGINPDELEVIPALPKENIFEENKMRRVAVYARVSTGDPRQTSSYELQKNHYLDVVNRNPSWSLVDIYPLGTENIYSDPTAICTSNIPPRLMFWKNIFIMQ